MPPGVTVCLLNWRREEHLGPIFRCLGGQTLRPRIMLWHNGDGDTALVGSGRTGERIAVEEHPLVDLYVSSHVNVGCYARWWMAAHAETEFIATLDDDLMLRDARVLEDAVAAQREECPDGIVGFFGWRRVEGRGYQAGRHTNGLDPKGEGSVAVDAIKGRFMVMPRRLLERVPLVHPALADRPDLVARCDDLAISLAVSRGVPGRHLVPRRLGKRWKELGQMGVALAGEPGHYRRRDEAVRLLLDYYADGACA